MIIFLASFCVFVGVLIYQIYPSETEPVIQRTIVPMQQKTKPLPSENVKSSVVFRGIRQKPAKTESAPAEDIKLPVKTSVKETVSAPQEDIKLVPQKVQKEEPTVDTVPVVVPVPTVDSPSDVMPVPQKKQQPTDKMLTLEEALHLRDVLASGKSCSTIP